MKNTKTTISLLFALTTIGFLGLSCVNAEHKENQDKVQANQVESDFPYDLEKPVKYNMPHNLFEISGIVFHNGDAKEVFAIQDEDGDLFHLGLGDKESKYAKFGGKGDYEDLTIIKNHIIVLKSNGELHSFPIANINKSEIADVVKTKDLVPKAEYEGIAADEKTGLVYILTKDSKADSKAKKTSIYAFSFTESGSFKPSSTFDLSHKDIATASGSDKTKFRPSALAKNPKTNEWYILSSINKSIVVTDENFKVKASYPLNGSLFNQPEGIAFDKDNNLYISNEGGTLAAGNILMFKNKKP